MEQKLLLKAIREDIGLLEEMITSLSPAAEITTEEVGFALSRARNLVAELEMLATTVKYNPVEMTPAVRMEVPKQAEKPVAKPVKKEELFDLEELPVAQPAEAKSEQPLTDAVAPVTQPVEKPSVKVEAKEPLRVKEAKVVNPAPAKELTPDTSQTKALGETIEAHKSVNDLLVADKHDHLFEGKPLKSLREGVGINDRFLFIRELFGGDSDNFNRVIDELDQLATLNEAVSYLKANFKWSKSDSAEKFLQLVKRRYQS